MEKLSRTLPPDEGTATRRLPPTLLTHLVGAFVSIVFQKTVIQYSCL